MSLYLSVLIQRGSAELVSAETKPIFQVAETACVTFSLLASEEAVDFVPA